MQNFSSFSVKVLAVAGFVFAGVSSGYAAPVGGTGLVTPDVIFGSGNANGSFTGVQSNGVELGLRAKQRYPTPANVFNYDGVETYDFTAGESAPASGRPLWNFEWSINTDWDVANPTGTKLNDLTYSLSLDTDPGAGTTFTSFDLINQPYFDHAIGDNSTANGGGAVAPSGDSVAYAALLDANNVAQNSWAYHWFAAINPNIAGLYRIELTASDGSGVLASTGINVRVAPIPLPAALPLFGAGLAGLGLLGWRRKRATAVTA